MLINIDTIDYYLKTISLSYADLLTIIYSTLDSLSVNTFSYFLPALKSISSETCRFDLDTTQLDIDNT